ncbi:TPA: UDP-N-acetyl glucosamine 2-epimerase [Candidatus Woesearchaeota archaeon]|nr:UDP-N-acetyl glucosamine 2-epimerase [Candidatus Woesearchaeota archaeon]
MSRDKNLDEFKDFIGKWSSKTVKGVPVDMLLSVDGIPLSWFYRPILYSSLLPRPFATIEDLKTTRKIPAWKTALFSYGYRKYVSWSDLVKRNVHSQKISSAPSHFRTKPRVLLLTFTNHLGKETFRIGKIEQSIAQQSKAEPFTLVADPISRFSIRKISASDHTLYNYYTKEIIRKAGHLATQLSQQWRAISLSDKTKMFSYQSQDFYPYIHPNLDFLYSLDFITLVLTQYYAFQRVLEEENVQAIVLTSQNNIIEKCLIAASITKKIPVVVVQHGLGLGSLPTLDTPPNVYFSVFGQRHKNELISQGVSKNNIFVTGPIIFDGIEKFISSRKKNGKALLLATSPIVEDRFLEKNAYFSRIRKILSDLKKINLVITLKLHPREKHQAEYEQILQEVGMSGKVTSIINRDDHYMLIENSDLVITFGSTVALEAMVIGRPTLTINLFDEKNPLNDAIRSAEATTVVHYTSDIGAVAAAQLVSGASAEASRKAHEFVQELCYKIDGKASERVVQTVYNLMKL